MAQAAAVLARQQPVQMKQERALARPVGPDQGDRLAVRHDQINPAQGVLAVRITVRQSAHADRRNRSVGFGRHGRCCFRAVGRSLFVKAVKRTLPAAGDHRPVNPLGPFKRTQKQQTDQATRQAQRKRPLALECTRRRAVAMRSSSSASTYRYRSMNPQRRHQHRRQADLPHAPKIA